MPAHGSQEDFGEPLWDISWLGLQRLREAGGQLWVPLWCHCLKGSDMDWLRSRLLLKAWSVVGAWGARSRLGGTFPGRVCEKRDLCPTGWERGSRALGVEGLGCVEGAAAACSPFWEVALSLKKGSLGL